ncbi:MAG: glycosyltransferase family 2 protein [Clostridia bacterium]|nr:glycosyltransferase family 2 protein [Clostridia bacterium]
MNEYRISVIIPVYNAEKTLGRAVKSLLDCATPSLQIILSDDGSTDYSPTLCDTLAAQNTNVCVVHKENGGVSSARNAGLEVARGEWIGFLDADDAVEPDMYEYLISEAEAARADIAQGAVFLDNGESREMLFSPRKSLLLRTEDADFPRLFAKHVSYGSWCKIFKRRTLGDLRFDEGCAIGEDFRFNLDAIAKAGNILVCSKPVYHYIQNPEGAIHTIVKREHLTAFRSMIKKAESDYAGVKFASSVIDTALLLNVTDTASKAVLNGLDTSELFDALRQDVKRRLSRVLFGAGLPLMQRAKLLAIVLTPRLYKTILVKHKRK